METLYDVLEVSPKASPETIRAAYRSLMQRFHPDKHRGDPHVAEIAKRIVQAYQVLSDPEKRAVYDDSIRRDEKPDVQHKPTTDPPVPPPKRTVVDRDDIGTPTVDASVEDWHTASPYFSAAMVGTDFTPLAMEDYFAARRLKVKIILLSALAGSSAGLLAGLLFDALGPPSGLFIGAPAGGILGVFICLFNRRVWAADQQTRINRYLDLFNRFHARKVNITFNGYAFFFGFAWAMYRKLYSVSAVLLITQFSLTFYAYIYTSVPDATIGVLSLAVAITFGFTADRCLYQHWLVRYLRNFRTSAGNGVTRMTNAGGTNGVAAIASVFLFLFFQGFVVAILQSDVEVQQPGLSDGSASEASQFTQDDIILYDAAVARAERQFPEVNPDLPQYNDEVAQWFLGRINEYVAAGYKPAAAMDAVAGEYGAWKAAQQSPDR